MNDKPKKSRKLKHSVNGTAAKGEAPKQNTPFPVVGIGASAGGFEALELFLKHLPENSGLCVVIVQHLDPHHKSLLAELLQRCTPIPVEEITQGLVLQPDHIYVVPPAVILSVKGRALLMSPVEENPSVLLPIDYFFCSLADDFEFYAIGVVLSGMGQDGTLGLKAIKDQGGACFTQSVESAAYDSMPASAIKAGLPDIIGSPEILAREILNYAKNRFAGDGLIVEAGLSEVNGLEKIVTLLRTQTGHDFSTYKANTLQRRIERRMGLQQITEVSDYLKFLHKNPSEATLLFKEMLIGVTRFFRDHQVWDLLKQKGFPQIFSHYQAGAQLRAWTPACSTGEEAYTLAMTFKEALEEVKPAANFTLQIYATDLDQDAIAKARLGEYSDAIAEDVSVERLQRFFVRNEASGYTIGREIRDMVIFAPQDIASDPPFTKLDIITCRNLLIYLVPSLQNKLIPLFHYALNPAGLLMLGSAETVGQADHLFAPLEGKLRLYKRAEGATTMGEWEFPSVYRGASGVPNVPVLSKGIGLKPNLQSITEDLLYQHYTPSALLVTHQGDILYLSGKTGKYLEPPAGKANWNIFVMAKEGLSVALNEVFFKAVRERTTSALRAVPIGANNNLQYVDLIVHPLKASAAASGLVLVVFKDVAPPPLGALEVMHGKNDEARLREMAVELQRAHEELQSTREEMQSSQEELKSTNEELQSSNEELQSTNEELTTSKEEMQSMNEELQTVNHELQAKVEELSEASNDMKNLLNSTDIATLFLDSALCVRRFTNRTAKIIRLIPSDVGRPITDLSMDMDYPKLVDDVHQVLETFVSVEKEISAKEDHWYMVRVMPYCTQDNRIDGVVITFADISVAKKVEAKLIAVKSDLETQLKEKEQEIQAYRKRFGLL